MRSLLLVLVFVLSAPSVWAQKRDPAAAEALFQAAHAEMERGDVASACPKFKESHRLDPAPGTLLNIADCSEKLGRIAEAWTRYREVAEKLDADDPRRDLALERAKALAPRLPKLTIRSKEQLPAEATVERDGVVVGPATLGVALPVDPGDHVVVVRAPGHRGRTYPITMAERDAKTLVVELGEPLPEPPPAPPPAAPAVPLPVLVGPPPAPPPPPDPNSALRTAGWIVGGVGLASAIMGGIAGAVTLGARADVERDCDTKTKSCSSPQALDAAERGKVTGPLTTVGLTVGGAGLLVGGILLGIGYSEPDTPQVGLTVGEDGAWLAIGGSF